MRDIKTKEHSRELKTRNPIARKPKELIRKTVSLTKEKIEQASPGKDCATHEESATEYASGKLESTEKWIATKAGEAAQRAGQKAVKTSYERIRQRKRGEDTVQESKEAADAASEVFKTSNRSSAENTFTPQAGRKVEKIPKETASHAAEQGKIRIKQNQDRLPSMMGKYRIKKDARIVKTSAIRGKPIKRTTGYMQAGQAAKGMHTAAQSTERSVQAVNNTAKGTKATAKGAAAAGRAAVTAVKSMFAALGTVGGGIALFLLLILGVIGGAAFLGDTSSAEPLSAEVLAYTPAIQKYASQYGIPEYVSVLQAVMMQESGGRGLDPMQSSECPYNTRYPNRPNAIQEPEYSIEVGVRYYASCVQEAGCDSPYDRDKLKLSLQGYNYGNGYITWAIRNHGGYSEANALQFSQQQAASHGWARYGDPQYVPHVLRYYSGGNLFAGLFGNGQIVTTAKAQLGNEGGQKFWSWYGFQGRVEWCACFVSWCADQSGLISSGEVLKFAYCPTGVEWFKSQGRWQDRGYTPTPGTIIFFDWNHDGISDHVGIVEKCEKEVVYTIEGNSSDAVRGRSYGVDSSSIMGYGLVNTN